MVEMGIWSEPNVLIHLLVFSKVSQNPNCFLCFSFSEASRIAVNIVVWECFLDCWALIINYHIVLDSCLMLFKKALYVSYSCCSSINSELIESWNVTVDGIIWNLQHITKYISPVLRLRNKAICPELPPWRADNYFAVVNYVKNCL